MKIAIIPVSIVEKLACAPERKAFRREKLGPREHGICRSIERSAKAELLKSLAIFVAD
jgi:hypothetical protein